MQQPFDGSVFGPVFPRLRDFDRQRSGFDRKGQRHRSALERTGGGISRVREHPDHLPVFREHFGDESPYSSLARRRGDVFEQYRTNASALMGVLDDECHLGIGRVEPVVPGDTDEWPPISATSATRSS